MLEKINNKSAPKEVVKALVTLYHQGKFDEILKQENELINLYPDSVDLYNIFGSTNLALNQFKNAIGNFKKAIKINPNLPIIFYNLGLSFHYDKNFESALSSYEKAIKLNPDHADTYCNMGMSFNEKGDFKRAIKSYRKTLEINPDHMGAHYNLGAIYSKTGELNLAIKNYKKATSVNPKNASIYNSLGEVYYKMGNLNESIINYKKAIELQPTFWQAYNNLGIALKDQGKLEEAIEAFNRAISIKPDYATAKHMLSALTGNTNETAPREYVENLFDDYAKKFETSLVDKLEYKIPKLIRDILIKPNNKKTLGSVLDLGCGTGLLGPEIKNHCSKLEGIDLSNKMLTLAKQKNIYDKLNQFDIIEYLSTTPLGFDYYVALDVFVYVGELTEIFRLIKSRNKKPGHLVFSTEHTEKDGYHLLRTLRYSHSKSYIENLCKKFDYNISHFSTTELRKEKGDFLTGGIYILSFKP